jgi:hypothetical protein
MSVIIEVTLLDMFSEFSGLRFLHMVKDVYFTWKTHQILTSRFFELNGPQQA